MQRTNFTNRSAVFAPRALRNVKLAPAPKKGLDLKVLSRSRLQSDLFVSSARLSRGKFASRPTSSSSRPVTSSRPATSQGKKAEVSREKEAQVLLACQGLLNDYRPFRIHKSSPLSSSTLTNVNGLILGSRRFGRFRSPVSPVEHLIALPSTELKARPKLWSQHLRRQPAPHHPNVTRSSTKKAKDAPTKVFSSKSEEEVQEFDSLKASVVDADGWQLVKPKKGKKQSNNTKSLQTHHISPHLRTMKLPASYFRNGLSRSIDSTLLDNEKYKSYNIYEALRAEQGDRIGDSVKTPSEGYTKMDFCRPCASKAASPKLVRDFRLREFKIRKSVPPRLVRSFKPREFHCRRLSIVDEESTH